MKLERNEKIFLDEDKTKESLVNPFLACRDGIVEMYEYRDWSGYGSETRLFLCQNVKHESTAIIRQTFVPHVKEWVEDSLHFDSDSFEFLEALIKGEKEKLGGKYNLVRNF